MNHPLASSRISALVALLTLPASAVVNIDWVTVGNAGNAADPATGSLYGAVSYAYNIAKNETTTIRRKTQAQAATGCMPTRLTR